MKRVLFGNPSKEAPVAPGQESKGPRDRHETLQPSTAVQLNGSGEPLPGTITNSGKSVNHGPRRTGHLLPSHCADQPPRCSVGP